MLRSADRPTVPHLFFVRIDFCFSSRSVNFCAEFSKCFVVSLFLLCFQFVMCSLACVLPHKNVVSLFLLRQNRHTSLFLPFLKTWPCISNYPSGAKDVNTRVNSSLCCLGERALLEWAVKANQMPIWCSPWADHQWYALWSRPTQVTDHSSTPRGATHVHVYQKKGMFTQLPDML